MKIWICIILTMFTSGIVFGQSISWGPSNPAGSANVLTVYTGTSTSSFEFTNNAVALTNASIQVDLGTGIEYVAGGLVATTSGSSTVTEVSATGDNPAVFNIGALAVGEQVTITFLRQATCAARVHKSGGGTFADVCHVLENGVEVSYANNGTNPFSAGYDVLYGNLVLGSVTHTPGSATTVGGTVNRSYNVTNGSFGSVGEFWVEDVFAAGGLTTSIFLINGVAVPAGNITQSAGKTVIHFDAALIALINGAGGTNGNGDALFEKDEFFTLSYDVTPLACGSNNTQISDLKVYYGEDVDTECTPSGTTSTSVSITNGTPLITVTRIQNDPVDLCLVSTHSIEIKNNGTGSEDFAKNIVVFMALRANNSPISTLSNVTMWGETYNNTRDFHNFTINGVPITLSQIAGIYSTMVDYLPPDFLTVDPDGAGTGLEDLDGDGFFDDLGPGESFIISFDIKTDPKNGACGQGRYDYMRWEHISADVNWENQCGVAQVPLRQEFSYKNMIRNYLLATFVTGPSDVNDGDNFDVQIKPHLSNTIACNGGNGLTGADVSWTVKCILPPGIILQANPPIDPANLPYAPSITQSGDTVYYTINRYRYDWFTFPLTLDCSQWDGTNPIAIDFITTYDCDTCYTQDMHCETHLIVPHCPGPCTGMTTDDFDIVRLTTGWTDATMTTPVVLTPGTHAINTMLPYDTIALTAKGHVADTLSDNLHLRLTYEPEIGGNILDYDSGEITLYDIDGAYGNTSFTFPITVPPTVTALGGGVFEWYLDLSSYITMVDPGYQIGEGMAADSFEVVIKAIYNSNPGYDYYAVENFRAFFFMYDDVPVERGCDSYGAPLYYSGFSYSVGGSVITLEGCNEKPIRTYGTWYNTAGSIFPNEYRPIERVDTVFMTLPNGAIVNNVTASSYSNGTASYYFDANNDLVIVPNSDYTPKNWTRITYPGFDVFVVGSCELQPGTYNVPITYIRTFYNYHPDASLHQTISSTSNTNAKITFIEPSVSLTPLGQIQQGITDTVSWDLEICNSTSDLGVDYSWISFDESASAGVSVVGVADITTGVEVPITPTSLSADVHLVETGVLVGGDCKTIRLYATYNDCAMDEIIINSGWSCQQYPASIDSLLDCSADDFLRVVPQEAQLAATITPLASTPSDPSDPTAGNHGTSTIEMCEPFPIEYTIVSSGTATIYDINFDILNPNLGLGLNYVPNSATIEVEGVDAPNVPRPFDATAEAAMVAGTINILLEDIDATNFGGGNGLTGAGINALQNEVIIRWLMEPDCDFVSGDKISIKTFGDAPCSDPAIGNGEQIVSSDLKINGVVLPYTNLMTSSFIPDNVFSGCSDTATLSVQTQVAGGVTGTNDSLFVVLAEGLVYNGSFTCISATCPVFIESRMELGREVIVFHYPSGLSNPVFDIELDVSVDAIPHCDSATVDLKGTAQIGGILCDGVACPNTNVITGTGVEGVVIEKPEFLLNFTSITYNSATNLFTYTLDVTNNGIPNTDSVEVDIYCSNVTLDGIDAASGVVTTIMVPVIATGGTHTVSGTLSNGVCSNFTGFAAVIDPVSSNGVNNCSCDPGVLTVMTNGLPVELTSFEGKLDVSCQVSLYWNTESETNFSHYEVERSMNGNDFLTYEIFPGEGGPLAPQSYRYVDLESSYLEGKVYYRLKMVDLDGTFDYSKVVVLSLGNCDSDYGIQLYPNPVLATGELRMVYEDEHISQDENIQVLVYDIMGKILKFQTFSSEETRAGVYIDINGLSAGSYILFVRKENTEYGRKKKFIVK